MQLSGKQTGVAKGMALAVLVSILIIVVGIFYDPFNIGATQNIKNRTEILGSSLLLPILVLLVSIARLARHRFFSPYDIDGSGLSTGSKKAVILQSLLQNTLEQAVLASGAYVVGCLTMPSSWLSVIPLCSIAFLIGRISFFIGYEKGAASRAFGFALTFYPTAGLILLLLACQLKLIVS